MFENALVILEERCLFEWRRYLGLKGVVEFSIR